MSNDLADGFVAHLLQWAERSGATPESLPPLAAAGRLASLTTLDGNVCTDLDTLAKEFPEHSASDLRLCLLASGMVGTGERDRPLPLVLDGDGRIYLHRYFDYERRLAASLLQRTLPDGVHAPEAWHRRLDALFARNGQRPDWQKLATALACRNRLTIISGGPGTGKTTTVAALLACLLAENPALRVALAAPTGKAAARLLEALRRRAGTLPATIQALLPRQAHTLHRLLGVTSQTGRFRHHAGNPLPVDVLVVDEASMLDLALACRICEAVPAKARLILLGDQDQLAAVEAGAVFAEISSDATWSAGCIAELAQRTATPANELRPPRARAATPLHDCVVWFSESHRFAGDSGIGRLAAAITAGRGAEACADLATRTDPSVTWLDDAGAELTPAVEQMIVDSYRPYFAALANRHTLPETRCQTVFAAFDRFRVLCALRETPRGTQAINRLVEGHSPSFTENSARGEHSPWYTGRPVMILRNDYLLRLFNGDIGICLPDEAGEPMVWFAEPDGRFRPLAPIRLPEHETAFAMTVHKAQGSEFGSVLLLLPARSSRVLTRELLYTGVTRAAQHLCLIVSRELLIQACANPTRRHSGLIARLAEASPEPPTAASAALTPEDARLLDERRHEPEQ